MRGVCLFLIFLTMWAQAAGAQSIITVEIHEDGNALWTMEKRLPLPNQTDIDDWEEFIKTGETGDRKDLDDFSRRIDWFLLSAQKFSGRPMKAINFNISYNTAMTPSSAYGIIQYSFEWRNFSHSDAGNILIGDAFSEGMVLSQDNVLVIKIPDGYDVKSASPGFDKRDGSRLIWDGTLYPNFARGEPAVVLMRSGISPWPLIGIVIVIALGASIMFFKKKDKPGNKNDAPVLQENPADDMKYEEMIESFLIRSGGQASQSDIIKEIGLSKSRISTILSRMKENGHIIKIKGGKGNLIRLVEKR